jgi:hypothetical protein
MTRESRMFGGATAAWIPTAYFVFPVAVFVLNVCITWNRWTDPLVDGGRELHVPARIVQGERLYTDIHYYYGPLAPYLNALGFKLFGIHTCVLVWLGIIASALGLLALYRIALRYLNPPQAALTTATVAAIPLFLPIMGAVPLPYSYSVLYASILGWWALEIALRRADGWEWKSGVLLGFSACAKPEAAGNFILAILLVEAIQSRNPLGSLKRFLIPIAGVAGMVYIPFLFLVPPHTLWTEGFLTMFRIPREWQIFYLHVSGLDWIGIRLLELVVVLLGHGTFLFAFCFLAIFTTKHEIDRNGTWLAIAFGVIALVGGAILIWPPNWLRFTATNLPPIVRIFPPACAVWICVIAYRLGKNRLQKRISEARANSTGLQLSAVPVLLILAAGLTSWRVLLNARYSTGYSALSLVLPVLLTGIVLLKALPAYVEKRFPGAGVRFLSIGFAALVSWQIVHLTWNVSYFRTPERWRKVEAARGFFWVTPPERGRLFGEALSVLLKQKKAGESLAAFPEGSMFNFLGDLPTPLPQEQFLPGMLDRISEKNLVRKLEQSPPQWVVVTSADYSFFGAGQFGVDFYQRIGNFIRSNYRLSYLFRSYDPTPAGGFGNPVIAIYRVKEKTAWSADGKNE